MSILLKLLLAGLRRHRLRVAITLAAIAIAIVGVGMSLQGLQLASRKADRIANQFGPYHVAVIAREMRGNRLDAGLIAGLAADDAVRRFDRAVTGRIDMVEPTIAGRGPFSGASLMGIDSGEALGAMAAGRWFAGAGEAVITTSLQQRSKLALGDRMVIAGAGGGAELTVVGIVEATEQAGHHATRPPQDSDCYLPLPQARQILGLGTDSVGSLLIALAGDDEIAPFAGRWEQAIAASLPLARLRTVKQGALGRDGEETAELSQMLMGTSTFLWTLTAGFIVFLSLSIGARARLRQLAVLRTLAMTRGQAVLLTLLEALLLAASGWLLGLIVFTVIRLIGIGGSLLPDGLLLLASGLCVFSGALVAALPVAWQIMRLKPMAILGDNEAAAREGIPLWLTLTGLACIVVNPLLILAGQHEGVRSLLALVQGSGGFGAPLLGSTLMIVGFALITPAVIRIAQRLFSPPLAALLRLDPRFLRQQLSAGLWRNVGTTVALSAGLGLYITGLVWGFSMLVPFTPTDALPRMMVDLTPEGIPLAAIDEVQAIPGVRAETVMPVAIENPRLSTATLARPEFAHIHEHQRHLLVVGVDGARAFAGQDPLLRLDIIEGSTRELTAAPGDAPRPCVIPDHFAFEAKLAIGDTFACEKPDAPAQSVDYRVVAIADIPGWNWLTKFSKTRTRAGRALAMVFTDEATVRADYGLTRLKHVWFEVDAKHDFAADLAAAAATRPAGPRAARPAADAAPARGERSGRPASQRGGRAGAGNPWARRTEANQVLTAALTPLAKRHAGPVQGGFDPASVAKATVTDSDDIKRMIGMRAGGIITGFSLMPLIMLLISSLAVVNTILASVRSRNWQFGILRSIGMTGGQLLRLILAESLQLWAAASVLSIVSGIALGWAGTRLCALFFFFAGRTPPLTIPWAGIAVGLVVGLLVCVGAALVPAVLAGRKRPMHFIQRGRLAV